MARTAGITSHLIEFREQRDLLALLRAVMLIVRQGRSLEVLYGAYCHLAHAPSQLSACQDTEALAFMLARRSEFARPATLTRDHIVELYGDEFQVSALPADFRCATYESVRRAGDRLIVGEYGEGARLAYLTPGICTISAHYGSVAGVRHIHSILRYGDEERYLVATGDGTKVLDLWAATPGGDLRMVKRLRRRLAGFTAAARVNGEYYFGSDFSGRPNYIETLAGEKYFFPPKAYRLFVTAFFAFFDRYIVSVNNALRVAGGARTLSIFDTLEKRFTFCEYLDIRRP